MRGRGDYTAMAYRRPGRVYMRGRGDYTMKKKQGGWSAPKIGGGIGRAVGNALMPIASEYVGPGIASQVPNLTASAGKSLGKLFKSITGWGDYTVHDNSLLYPDKIVPQFGEDSIRVKKREYIAQIDAFQTFTNLQIPIQPGLDTSFPWLSRIAANYEQYHINGMVFQYVSTSSDAIASTSDLGLGTIALATDYDAQDPAFVNLPQMLGSMFSNSGKPSENIMHAIECAPNEQAQKLYYVRTGDVPSGADIRLYDLGTFQIATDRMPGDYDGAGQLWVSYDITFTKSVQNNQLGFDINTDHFELVAPSQTSSNYFGTSRTAKEESNLGCSVTNNQIAFPSTLSSGYYLIMYTSVGSSTALLSPTSTLVNCTRITPFTNDTVGELGNGGTTSPRYFLSYIVRIDGNNATITFSGGTLPSSPTFGDLIIQQLNGEIYVDL